jgi:hypothetical protein
VSITPATTSVYDLDASAAVTTVVPTVSAAASGINATQRNLLFFIDKNGNNIKDSGEAVCQACYGKSLVFAGAANAKGIVPALTSLTVSNSAKVTESSIGSAVQVWGVINDRSVMVVPTEFGFGDNVNDVDIPVLEITGVVAGVNANITDVTNTNDTISYSFSTLIPILKTAYTNQSTIWIKYIPDTTNTNLYYLTDSVIEMNKDKYVINADWNQTTVSANMLNAANVEFVIK